MPADAHNPTARLPGLRWPLPAVLAWALAWLLLAGLRQAGAGPAAAWVLAAAAATLAATRVQGRWRQWLVAGGFPLSSLALGASAPAWWWGLAALPLALAYPLRAWGDAPFFPTPRHALQALGQAVALPAGASVLDAGCGLGHGLQALRAIWPQARLEGVEWSRPLAWRCQRRCPWAEVRRGDLWADDWSALEVVYLFQRPETMPRAAEKARREMRPGTWLVSLEFPVPDWTAHATLAPDGGRTVWVYRLPQAGRPEGKATAAATPGPKGADRRSLPPTSASTRDAGGR
jgi:hypothetical protein